MSQGGEEEGKGTFLGVALGRTRDQFWGEGKGIGLRKGREQLSGREENIF